MDLADPVAVALAVADCLRAEALPHALYGGLLLAAYGDARETKDVDLAVVNPDPGAVAGLLDRRLGLRTVLAFERQAFGGVVVSRVTLVEGEELNTLDLVEPADSAYAVRAMDRAIDSTLRDRPIRVLSPEDFVLFKLLSSRERDLEDARSVVRALGSELDEAVVDEEVRALAKTETESRLTARWRSARRP
ncbi:MAG: nucleotidyltransferase [Myxococcota bacterium]